MSASGPALSATTDPRSAALEELRRPGLKELMDAYELELIQSALAEAGGHQRRAARALGLLPTTLHEKMKRLGLRPRLPEPSAQASGAPGIDYSAPHLHSGLTRPRQG